MTPTGWYGPMLAPIACPTCGGQVDELDLPETQQDCPTCGGDGWVIPDPPGQLLPRQQHDRKADR